MNLRFQKWEQAIRQARNMFSYLSRVRILMQVVPAHSNRLELFTNLGLTQAVERMCREKKTALSQRSTLYETM